jgi:ribonucleoside-diphosphate reductase alpha chain
MQAYKSGCKGVTVYREGSRSGVLISNKKKEDSNLEITYKDAPKRPKVLDCDIYNTKALGKDWTVIVGTLKGKPYELFAFQQLESYEFPNDIKKGILIRKYKNNYQLLGIRGEKEYVIDNIVKYMEIDEQYQTRDVSKDLRHGIHPKFIVSDIEKTTSISSFRKVVAKVLKHYLEESDLKEKCPECGFELIMQDGCKKCSNCGYSACG